MKPFRFKADIVVLGGSAEDVLNALAGHLGDCARHLGNERAIGDVCRHFTLEEAPADSQVTDLVDHALEESVPIELNLDPKSPAGIALAQQQEREKSEREAAAAARANEGKTDAEIMAEHSAKEQAALNG